MAMKSTKPLGFRQFQMAVVSSLHTQLGLNTMPYDCFTQAKPRL